MEMIHEAGQYVDTVKRVCDAVGGEVTFRGTVHRVRDMSDFSFVVMRVERGLIQCTFQGDEIGGILNAAGHAHQVGGDAGGGQFCIIHLPVGARQAV